MISALALILVINAHLTVSQSGPDLPDDFQKSGESGESGERSGVSPPVQSDPVQSDPVATPSISLSYSPAESQLIRSTGTRTITERWLVSEPWCRECPAAKRRFLAAGNPKSRVITMAEAKRLHGKIISGVPAEYMIEKTESIEYVQPPLYRKINRMLTTLDGSATPGNANILKHLRTAGPHQGKHWQKWHLETWHTEQLYALHDDDHSDVVPVFDESARDVEARISNAPLSADSIAAAISAHLIAKQKSDQVTDGYAGLFDIEVEAPDSARSWASDLLSKECVEFPSAGVSASWKGKDRTISVAPGVVRISPGVAVSVKKYGITVSTTLIACSFDPALSWVRLELTNAPDLTVRFK